MRRPIPTLLLVVSGLIALGATAGDMPPNFGIVIEKGIYRGGQPVEAQMDSLHRLGVKTILKLNTHGLDREREVADRLGIKLVHIPFEASTIGSPETCRDVASALEVLDDRSNWPIYVHCSKGSDRAGYLVGVFRELVQNWTWEQVDEELAAFGHKRRSRRAFPQITAELRAGLPSCSNVVPHEAAAP